MIEQVTIQLTGLLHSYHSICAQLTARVDPRLLPPERSSVPEYQAAWEEAVVASHAQARALLEEICQVTAASPRYAEAAAPLLARAHELLDSLPEQPDATFSDDLSAFALFADACHAGASPTSELLTRLENCGDLLPRPVIFGLLLHQYSLPAPLVSDDPLEDLALPEDLPPAEGLGIPDDPESIADEPATEDEPVTEDVPIIVDEPAAEDEPVTEDNPIPVDEPLIEPAPFTEDEPLPVIVVSEDDPMLHPIEPLQPIKLPSEQKLAELYQITHPVMATLLDKLAFFGLMDMAQIQFYAPSLPQESISHALNLLISRGYLTAYELQERLVFCFTPQMDDCIRKASLAEVLRQLTGWKKLTPPSFLAADDVPREDLLQHLQRSDLLQSFLGKLRKNALALRLLPSSYIDDQLDIFLRLKRPGYPLTPLLFVTADEFSATPASESMGVICQSDDPPDMTGVADEMHFCFCSSCLLQWRGGHWINLTP